MIGNFEEELLLFSFASLLLFVVAATIVVEFEFASALKIENGVQFVMIPFAVPIQKSIVN